MRLSVKLIGLFLLLGIAPLVATSILVNIQASQVLQEKSYAQMESIRETRKFQIENYFEERLSDTSVLAESVAAAEVVKLAHRVFHETKNRGEGDKIGGADWQKAVADPLTTWLEKYKAMYGYYDLFLIDPDGYVVFTVARESDLGENLLQGPLRDSGLARLFVKAKNGVALEDFAPYAPSNNAQAAFVAAPVQRNGEFLGVIALQLSVDAIDAMVSNRAGMGRTEEAFLVGKVGDVSSYRSNRKVKEGRIGGAQSSAFVGRALAGESGAYITMGSTGQKELVSFTPLKIPGFHWAIIVTIAAEEAFSAVDGLSQTIIRIALLCVVLVSLVGWFFARSISQPLLQVVNVISSSAAQMAASLTEQERVATQQSASVNETNTTMEELGASARQSAEQAEAAANGADKALELSQFGLSRVEETMNNMEQAKAKVDAIAQQILLLSEKTGQIREITNLVSDFANETKMLAMNAAVEAVRAGEHGKGFAVLAVETRKLADESKRSAGRINALVAEIQKATNSTVMATEEGGKTVDEGMQISQNTAETFREMEQAMGSASQGAQQISLNVRQQSVAVRQVVEAMKSVNSGARETASGMSQVKEGIRTLNEAAQTLRAMV